MGKINTTLPLLINNKLLFIQSKSAFMFLIILQSFGEKVESLPLNCSLFIQLGFRKKDLKIKVFTYCDSFIFFLIYSIKDVYSRFFSNFTHNTWQSYINQCKNQLFSINIGNQNSFNSSQIH